MRIVFMGTPESAVPSLQRLLSDGHEVVAVWTQPDKPAGRGDKLHAPPVKEFALAHGLTVVQLLRSELLTRKICLLPIRPTSQLLWPTVEFFLLNI
jgi:methionyl-tRNA formyltransferase